MPMEVVKSSLMNLKTSCHKTNNKPTASREKQVPVSQTEVPQFYLNVLRLYDMVYILISGAQSFVMNTVAAVARRLWPLSECEV